MDKITVFDFGSQYTQLIARRVRELGVYCEIIPFSHYDSISPDTKAIILSGSPCSVNDEQILHFELDAILDKYPILGICYGAQFLAAHLGGNVEPSQKREYGRAQINIHKDARFFKGIQDRQVWMSHADTITRVPTGFKVIATTDSIPIAAFESSPNQFAYPVIGIQFHPEVTHTHDGSKMLEDFVIDIAGCNRDWSPASFVEMAIEDIRTKVGDDEVLLALSGGVDSSVVGQLLHQAIGARLKCYFIDNGLLRKNEFDEVLESYKSMGLNIKGIDAKQRFLDALKGVSDPESKRKIIGRLFIKIFEEEAKAAGDIKWLAQGTIYPDVIESVSVHGPSVTIKSHHNVGGLPEKFDLKIIEPIRLCFKDEVRAIGREIHVPEHILNRHPFPGPGLGIRVLGDITAQKLAILQEADHIFISNLQESGYYAEIWQAGAMLLPIKSVGVMGDERTYEMTVALRAVHSLDGMTADWADLPHTFLARVSNQIINQVKGVNRVVYDISSKPPATIEWE